MEKKPDLVRVIVPKQEGAAFLYVEYEIAESVLKKQGKQLSSCEPDIFAIYLNQVTKLMRNIFGI